MLHRALIVGLVVASAGWAHALTLDNVRVQATLIDGSTKDPFRVRAHLGGADARGIVRGFASIRFGDLKAEAPAGGFVRRGNAYTWRSGLFGVKKVTINVKKGTIDIAGGGLDLGDFPGPVRLAIGTSKGVACGTFEWSGAQVTRAAARGRGIKKTATGPLEPCFVDDGLDHDAPVVFITSPTPLAGTTTIAPSIDIGGDATDAVGIVGLQWSSDQGSGASLVPTSPWSVAGIGLAVGDNRITVTATDAAGNVGSDVLDVTYNTNGILFEGVPIASPEAVLMEDAEDVNVRQKIVSNPDLDTDTVQILHVLDDGSMVPVGGLGDLGKQGDALPGDDVYSGMMGLPGGPDGTKTERFRVAAYNKMVPDVVALSPVVTIPRVDLVKLDAVTAAITLADNARTLFTSMLGDGADEDTALAEVAKLAKASGAPAAGASDGKLGAWWVTEDGLLGGMFGYDETSVRGGAAQTRPQELPKLHPLPNITAGVPAAWNEVGSRRSIILAPSFSEQEPHAVDDTLRGMQCPYYDVDTFFGTKADAERFKQLEEYGLILIASHGDTLFDALGDAYHPEWDWKSAGAQTVVLTGTRLSNVNLRKWQRDLRMGRMAVFPEGQAGILPSFFTQYSARLPQSIVYVGTCRSSANQSLSSALLERGAGTYLGYDGYVDSSFAGTVATDVFTKLLAGQSLTTAFTPGMNDGGSSSFTLDGSSALSLATGTIVNRSFEVQSGFLASVAGFTVTGDGRIIGNLGLTYPTDGTRMALLSTGLGLTAQSGTFSQSVCLPPLPPGATTMTLMYDWDFFSEEFLEFCDSQFQDFFHVNFGATELQNTTIKFLCHDPNTTLVPADVAFDKGDVYMTGWRTQSVDVTALAGTTANLQFAAGDVGDSIYDTVILVDNVRLVVQ